jgi:hypothetical protein
MLHASSATCTFLAVILCICVRVCTGVLEMNPEYHVMLSMPSTMELHPQPYMITVFSNSLDDQLLHGIETYKSAGPNEAPRTEWASTASLLNRLTAGFVSHFLFQNKFQVSQRFKCQK